MGNFSAGKMSLLWKQNQKRNLELLSHAEAERLNRIQGLAKVVQETQDDFYAIAAQSLNDMTEAQYAAFEQQRKEASRKMKDAEKALFAEQRSFLGEKE